MSAYPLWSRGLRVSFAAGAALRCGPIGRAQRNMPEVELPKHGPALPIVLLPHGGPDWLLASVPSGTLRRTGPRSSNISTSTSLVAVDGHHGGGVRHHRTGTLQGDTLTLTGVMPHSIIFADRPVRAAGQAAVFVFWKKYIVFAFCIRIAPLDSLVSRDGTRSCICRPKSGFSISYCNEQSFWVI